MAGRKFRGVDDDYGWINRRFADLERQLRELRAVRSLEGSSIGRGGLTVMGSGGIKLVDDDGNVMFEFHGDPNIPDPDGKPQPRLVVNRVDGTACLLVDDPAPMADGYHQFIRIWDRSGNEIFSEDANSGVGIANPWLTGTMFPARYTDWPKSTSGTFETLWQGQLSVKNPTLTVGAMHTSDDSATTGEVRCQVENATFGDTVTIGFVITGSFVANQLPWPAGVDINDAVTVTLQARRTAGTGNVMIAPLFSTGSQSL